MEIDMSNKRYTFANILIIFALAFVCFFSVCGPGINYAFADNTEYTDVLEDLTKDETFDAEVYPVVENDYSLQVIQIAESEDKELFVYVYQPSGTEADLRATSISISTGINEDLSFKLYDLSLINSDGVFYKYKVENLKVSDQASVRFYNISEIFREYIDGVDEKPSEGNTIDEVTFEVAQLWTVTIVDDTVTYSCTKTETVLVTDKYVGFLRYVNGWAWATYYCDSHFVAFSTDLPMDSIIEAELSFATYEYDTLYDAPVVDVDNRDPSKDVDHHIILTNDDVVNNQTVGLFGEGHQWNRIETVSEFLENEEDLEEDAKVQLENKQWVLRFYETEYSHSGGNLGNLYGHGTGVVEVTILRLKFETDGITYDLGVVDNKQSGSLTPSNEVPSWWTAIVDWFNKLSLFFKIVYGILIGVVLLIFVYFLVKLVVSAFKAINKLFKGDKK